MYGTLACRSPCLAVFGDFWHGFHRSYTERMRGNGERESGKQRGDIFGIFLNKKCCHVIKSMLTHFSIRHISTKLTVVDGETNYI